MTAIKTQSGNVTQSTAYFDLKEFVAGVANPEVAAQMAQAIAFRADVALTSAVRSLFMEMREEVFNEGNAATADEAREVVEDALASDEMSYAFGVEHGGVIQSICELTALRAEWHTLAKELTALTFSWDGSPRTYTYVEDVQEMLARDVKLSVKSQTKMRIQKQVQRRYDGMATAEDMAKLMSRRIEREEQRAEQRAERLNQQKNALSLVYSYAENKGIGLGITEAPAFHTLPVKTRFAMLAGAVQGAERADEYAASSSSITDTEFDAIGLAVMNAIRTLNTVLRSPAYAQQG